MHLVQATSVLILAAQAWAAPGEYLGSRHLWYDTPGHDLKSGLPIGNGRLGALVHGSAIENITLNENSVWSGGFQDRVNPGSLDAFPVVRELLGKNHFTEAGELALRNMSGIPITSRWFSVTGELLLDFGHTEEGWSNYERWLNTLEGTTGVSYDWKGVTYTQVLFDETQSVGTVVADQNRSRETVANFPTGVVAVRLTASEDGALDFNASLFRGRGVRKTSASAEDLTLTMDVGGDGSDAVPFTAAVRVVTDGGTCY